MDFRDDARGRGEDGDNRVPRTAIRKGSPLVHPKSRRSPSHDDHDERPNKRSRGDDQPRSRSPRRVREDSEGEKDTTRRRSPGDARESRKSEARRDRRRDDDDYGQSREYDHDRRRGQQDGEASSSYQSSAPRRQERYRSRSPPPSRRSRSPQPRRTARRSPPARSRSPKRSRRRSYSRSRSPQARARKPLPSQEESYRGKERGSRDGSQVDAVDKPIEKEKPNFKPTGLLAAETNKVTVGSGVNAQNIVLKYHEPSEARKPPSSDRWMLYIFKGKDQDPVSTIELFTRSCWLLGRELAVADIPVEHPSCSKQHAVFQFRYTVKKNEWGESKGKVGLYLLDLESSNGTMLNGKKVEAARYVQCLDGDVVKFGDSEREYVLVLPPRGEK